MDRKQCVRLLALAMAAILGGCASQDHVVKTPVPPAPSKANLAGK